MDFEKAQEDLLVKNGSELNIYETSHKAMAQLGKATSSDSGSNREDGDHETDSEIDEMPRNQGYAGIDDDNTKIQMIFERITSQDARLDQRLRSKHYFDDDIKGISPHGLEKFQESSKQRNDTRPFDLQPHQREGIGRMRHFESGKDHACIVADDLGLGKTLQTLCLYEISKEYSQEPMLIVVSANLIANWQNELLLWLGFGPESVLVYDGLKSSYGTEVFKRYKVVLCSYNQLSIEFTRMETSRHDYLALQKNLNSRFRWLKGKTKDNFIKREISEVRPHCPMFSMNWGRVILDEAYAIRNFQTNICKGACLLKAKSRIAITGIPISNKYSDVHSLMVFLRIAPFNNRRMLEELFLKIERNEKNHPDGSRDAILNKALCSIMIRKSM
jgi:SNF2 family DNA or RNA helicase